MNGGVQSSTLKSYFSAIKHILKSNGYEWDDRKALLGSIVKGCKLENDTLKVRLPIQKGLLEILLLEIERYFGEIQGQPYLESMYKALFCIAYYGMMRVGELTLSDHTLKACDIHMGDNKDKMLLVLYTSKTHGRKNKPQEIKIAAVKLLKEDKKFFCPFETVSKFLRIRGPFLDTEEMLFVFRDHSPVKPHQFRCTLRLLLDRLDLDSSLYDVHSFRSGRTCDLARFGYSVDQIKAMGRWKSNAVYRYLKN